MKNTYWNNNGKYEATAAKLQALLPREGEMAGENNKALEKFRQAVNCYYDLYNNGLCNRTAEFRKLFGIAKQGFLIKRLLPWTGRHCAVFAYDIDFDRISEVVEPVMDKFVLAAGIEQGFIVTKFEEV